MRDSIHRGSTLSLSERQLLLNEKRTLYLQANTAGLLNTVKNKSINCVKYPEIIKFWRNSDENSPSKQFLPLKNSFVYVPLNNKTVL